MCDMWSGPPSVRVRGEGGGEAAGSGDAAGGPAGRSGGLALELPPALLEPAAQLADAGRAEAVGRGQLLRPVAQGHVQGEAAVARAQGGQPAGEVDAEG